MDETLDRLGETIAGALARRRCIGHCGRATAS